MDLVHVAQAIQDHAATAKQGTTACISVQIGLVLSLGYDPQERVSPRRLAKALVENAIHQLQLLEGPEDALLIIDGAAVIELRDEG